MRRFSLAVVLVLTLALTAYGQKFHFGYDEDDFGIPDAPARTNPFENASSESSKPNRPSRKDPFRNPNFVKTPSQLAAEFAAIKKAKMQFTGSMPDAPQPILNSAFSVVPMKRGQEELRSLMMFRAVVGLPFADMTLDKTQTAHAAAGAGLLDILGHLEHTPQKPEGLSDELYQWGYKGTSSGNLHMAGGDSGSQGSVRAYMNDSDPNNIKSLGHRRWCINPYMKTTGFGEKGRWSVMWSFDSSRPKNEFDYNYFSFPACGLTPVNMFEAKWAWSLVLNPAKYRYLGDDQFKISVRPAMFNAKTAALKRLDVQALELDSVKVDQAGYGVPLCVIFRPSPIQVSPGMAYCVDIDGFATPQGPTHIQYFVVFCKGL